jgi:hypothetical protein
VSDAERWRERVEDVLWIELGSVARRNGSRAITMSRAPGPHEPPSSTGVADAFEAIGLLDAASAESWRARLVGPRRPRVTTDELRSRVRAYLAELVRAALAAPSRDDDAWVRPQVVLNDLHAYGLLDQDERHWWFSLLAPGADESPGLPPVEQLLLTRLVRSIPGPPERRRGLRLLSVDLFEDGLCVHLHLARRGRDADDTMRPLPDELEPGLPLASRVLHARVEDDIGTEYLGLGGGGGGGGSGTTDGPYVGGQTQIFRTPVPPGATRLEVASGGVAFTVAV